MQNNNKKLINNSELSQDNLKTNNSSINSDSDSDDSQETRYTDYTDNDSDNELNFDVSRLQDGIALCEHDNVIPCLEEKDGVYFGSFNSINDSTVKYGYGRKKYNNGAIYYGEWKKNKRHGYGRFFDIDGSIYHGKWKNDMKCGRGRQEYFPNKIIYDGNWEGNKFNGYGVLDFTYKSKKYIGNFEEGLLSGTFCIIDNDIVKIKTFTEGMSVKDNFSTGSSSNILSVEHIESIEEKSNRNRKPKIIRSTSDNFNNSKSFNSRMFSCPASISPSSPIKPALINNKKRSRSHSFNSLESDGLPESSSKKVRFKKKLK
jgi:hypothetical protein